jgi:hypothetical protein
MLQKEPYAIIESLERDLAREEEILAAMERQLGTEEQILRRFEDDVTQLREALPTPSQVRARPPTVLRWLVAGGVALMVGVAGFGIGIAVEQQTTDDVRSELTTMEARLDNATHVGPTGSATTVQQLATDGFFSGPRRRG